MSWVGCQPRVELRKRNEQKYDQQKLTCSKLSAVVATANFQHKKNEEKDLWIPKHNRKRKALAKL
jgi:hypothetical protein